ncbi:MAG: lactate utilization protein [Chloroflexi bacterium]|nr:lactate utilization protein [Chloroflexota bacterium]
MDEHRNWLSEQKIERAAKALRKHGFNVLTVATCDQAREAALELIEPGAKVGIAGTVTIREIGLMDVLAERGNRVVHHWLPGLTSEQEDELRHEEMFADVFVCSSNAVTVTGELVNIDGTGNRVVSMIYGPRKIILIAGSNKIVPDVSAGIWRARNVAAALNAHRGNYDSPCGKIGYCTDCDSPGRICRVVSIIERRPSRSDVTVILVAEEVGF